MSKESNSSLNEKRPSRETAAQALAEAQARRESEVARAVPKETGGRKGLEPTRYGDWENKGIISDF